MRQSKAAKHRRAAARRRYRNTRRHLESVGAFNARDKWSGWIFGPSHMCLARGSDDRHCSLDEGHRGRHHDIITKKYWKRALKDMSGSGIAKRGWRTRKRRTVAGKKHRRAAKKRHR